MLVFMKLDKKKVETWRVLVVFMKRWRPVDRRFAPIDRGRHRFMKPPKPSRFQLIFLSSFMKPPPKPSRFQLIFLPSFMKPQMVSTFMTKNIRETTKNVKKNHETRSQKKMRGFSLKPQKRITKNFYSICNCNTFTSKQIGTYLFLESFIML